LRVSSIAILQAMIRNANRKCPELKGRAEKAGAILLTGKIRPTDPAHFQAESQSDASRSYAVDLAAEGEVLCTCVDAPRAPLYRGAHWCKHALAALFLDRLARRAIKRDTARLSRVQAYRPLHPRRPARRLSPAAA
jgi:uncharacterized Zn finger protein